MVPKSLMLLLLMAACGEAPSSVTPPSPPFGLAWVSVAPNGQAITVGDSLLFHATTNVPGTSGFTWAVNKPSFASISSAGWLRGLAAGTIAVQACVLPNTSTCGNAVVTVR